MNEKKFEELPSMFKDAAAHALSALITNGGVGMLINKLASGEDVGVKLALEIRKSFCALHSGLSADESQAKGQKTKNQSEVIHLNKAEIQSGLNRVKWAEALIRQLPENHDGRNSWLLNYGFQNNDASIMLAIREASRKAELATRHSSRF